MGHITAPTDATRPPAPPPPRSRVARAVFWLGARASAYCEGDSTQPTSEELLVPALPGGRRRSPRAEARVARRAARRAAAESAMTILTRIPLEEAMVLAEEFNGGQPRADRVSVGIENGCVWNTTVTRAAHLSLL